MRANNSLHNKPAWVPPESMCNAYARLLLQASLDGALAALRSVCGEEGVFLGEAIREQHGRDESVHRSVSMQTFLF